MRFWASVRQNPFVSDSDHAASVVSVQAIMTRHGLEDVANATVDRLFRDNPLFARQDQEPKFAAATAMSVRSAAGRLLRNNAAAVLADDPGAMEYDIDPSTAQFLKFEQMTTGANDAAAVSAELLSATLRTLRDFFAKADKPRLAGFMSEKIAAASRSHANGNFYRLMP